MNGRVLFGMLVVIGAFCADPVIADDRTQFFEPPRGSPDRRQILALWRAPMQELFRQRVELVISVMSISGDAAYARAHPQQPGGAPLTIDFPCEVSGNDLELEATFVKRHGVWAYDVPADGRISMCADDVTTWDRWLRKMGLPPQFVGRTQFLDDAE